MFCPKCRGEYVEGVTECAHCEIELVAEIPAEDIFASPEAMARALAGKELEAVMVGPHVPLQEMQRYLAERHIPTVIAGEADQEIESALHARFFLMIEPERIPGLQQAIEERWRAGLETEGLMLDGQEGEEETTTEAEGACQACGTEIPPEAAECPECGLFVGAPDE